MPVCSTPYPALPGFQGVRGYAPSPVWSGSVRAPVRFVPIRKQEAARLYHQARAFERQTRQPGRQDGALGRNGLAVLHALVFDCLNYASGRLDPSYETLARLACISVRSVARGLRALKAAGVITWLRRCVESFVEGRFTLEQESNAYALRPVSQWLGFAARPSPPLPDPGTWGDHPPAAREALAGAVAALREGCGLATVTAELEADPGNGLAAVLARLGRAIAGETPQFSRSASLAKNHSPESIG